MSLLVGLPLTLFLASLPWAVMLLIRYAPISGWFKASGCCALAALYHAATPAVVERVLVLSGEEMEGAKFLTGDDQAWNRDYYHTMDTLPAGY